jgi:hypothetical protein
LQPKIQKISAICSEIENLEKRREASRINFDSDRNQVDRGNFFSNFNFAFNFGGNERDRNVKRDNYAISIEELNKLTDLKVRKFYKKFYFNLERIF